MPALTTARVECLLTPVALVQAKASSARCAELEQQADEVRRSNDDSVRQFKTAIIQARALRLPVRMARMRTLQADQVVPSSAGQDVRGAGAFGSQTPSRARGRAAGQRCSPAHGRVAPRGELLLWTR